MNCNCNCGHILCAPYGNPFKIAICRSNVAPGNPDNITFADIDDLRVEITRIIRNKHVQHEVMENGDLLIDIPVSAQSRTTFGILMTGTYNGHPWRWKCGRAFRISDTNCESSVQGMESFGVETYYLGAASPGKIYYGAGETESSATTVFSNLVSPAGTYNVTVSTTGHYIFFVIPNSMSISSATMSGFDFPLSEPTATTMGGEAYKVYRSDSPIDAGIYEIVIK